MLQFTNKELDIFVNKINDSHLPFKGKINALETYIKKYKQHVYDTSYRIFGSEEMISYSEQFETEKELFDRVEWLYDNEHEHKHNLNLLWVGFPDKTFEKLFTYSLNNR